MHELVRSCRLRNPENFAAPPETPETVSAASANRNPSFGGPVNAVAVPPPSDEIGHENACHELPHLILCRLVRGHPEIAMKVLGPQCICRSRIRTVAGISKP